MASWSIVTTLKEPLVMTLKYVSYHIDMGVDKIYLYFDDPADPAIDILKHIEKVEVTICDDMYWAQSSLGNRPVKHQHRQLYNADATYYACQSDWLIHMDVDELLSNFEEGVEIAETLDETDADVLRILPMEPFWTGESSQSVAFHGGQYDANINLSEELFGVKTHNSLLIEHYAGKCFVKTGFTGVRVRLHRPSCDDATWKYEKSEEIVLLHLLNFGVKRWAEKYIRRIGIGTLYPFGFNVQEKGVDHQGVAVFRQIELAYERDGISGIMDFFMQVKKVSPEALLELYKIVPMKEFEFDFVESVGRHVPTGFDLPKLDNDLFDWRY